MEKEEFYTRQYEILISLFEIHHKRWIDHWRTYLTILAIITASIAAIIKIEDGMGSGDLRIVLFSASFLGLCISIFGWISLNRIMNDYNLNYSHIRKMERIIEKEINDKEFLKIFVDGKQFFADGVFDEHRYRPWCFRFLRNINQYKLATLTFLLFMIFFILILLTM